MSRLVLPGVVDDTDLGRAKEAIAAHVRQCCDNDARCDLVLPSYTGDCSGLRLVLWMIVGRLEDAYDEYDEPPIKICLDCAAVLSVARGAFAGESWLVEVRMANVRTVKALAWSGCTNLATVALNTAESIGEAVFDGCSGLRAVDAPHLQTIGREAFSDCSSLATVRLPNVTSIGTGAFRFCTSLVGADLPSVQTVECGAFRRCSALVDLRVPAVREVADAAFDRCVSLNAINAPQLQTIGREAFCGCSSLADVRLLRVAVVGYKAFFDCALTTVAMPNVRSVDVRAFRRCRLLTRLVCPGPAVPAALRSAAGPVVVVATEAPEVEGWTRRVATNGEAEGVRALGRPCGAVLAALAAAMVGRVHPGLQRAVLDAQAIAVVYTKTGPL